MMKSTAIKQKIQPTEKYPYIGIHQITNSIVLFTAEKSGFVINCGDHIRYELGTYATDWIEPQFQHYTGQVILEN